MRFKTTRNGMVSVLATSAATFCAAICSTLVATADPGTEPATVSATEPATEPTAGLYLDITETSGIHFHHDPGDTGRRYLPETMGSGGCVLDANRDGRLDVYLVQSGPLPPSNAPEAANQLFLQAEDHSFYSAPENSGAGDQGYGQGAVCGDLTGDGITDIYITNFGPNVLLRGSGDGTFENITIRAGVGDPSWSSSATLFDADGDGQLDIYVVNYLDFTVASHRDCRHHQAGASIYCHPDTYPTAPDRFYHNNGDGTFTDTTRETGLIDRDGKGLGVVAADLDNNGTADLYVTNDSTPNFLYLNRGGRFEEAGLFFGGGYNEEGRTEAGMGVDAGDVDGNGYLDLFVTNLSLETNTLYLGSPVELTDATRRAGLHTGSFPVLGFGTHLADLDHDRDLDLIVLNGDVLDNVHLLNDALSWRQPGQIFYNDGSGRFSQLPAKAVGDLAVPRVARGSMLFDHDNDGDLDLLVSYNRDQARLYQHTGTPSGNHWLGLELRATPHKATGRYPTTVGTRVTLHLGDHHLLREAKTASSYLTSSDPRLHFGLGNATRATITIRWPDGTSQAIENLAAGKYHLVEQPSAATEPNPPSR